MFRSTRRKARTRFEDNLIYYVTLIVDEACVSFLLEILLYPRNFCPLAAPTGASDSIWFDRHCGHQVSSTQQMLRNVSWHQLLLYTISNEASSTNRAK